MRNFLRLFAAWLQAGIEVAVGLTETTKTTKGESDMKPLTKTELDAAERYADSLDVAHENIRAYMEMYEQGEPTDKGHYRTMIVQECASAIQMAKNVSKLFAHREGGSQHADKLAR